MDRKVIKLEAAFGSDRQAIVVKRNRDLLVSDVMEDIARVFKIPVDEQVIFHRGTNLSDFPNEPLENLGVENNNVIRVTRDPELPSRSPRRVNTDRASPVMMMGNGVGSGGMMGNGGGGSGVMMTGGGPGTSPRYVNGYAGDGLDPISYLKEVSPFSSRQPNNYQMQSFKWVLSMVAVTVWD